LIEFSISCVYGESNFGPVFFLFSCISGAPIC
jgi:hypothetical protein